MTKNERTTLDWIISTVINKYCSCGGSGPDDDGCCEACKIYHLINDGIDTNMQVEGKEK